MKKHGPTGGVSATGKRSSVTRLRKNYCAKSVEREEKYIKIN